MLHPESGIQICSADPPGVSGTYICVCDGKNCNDQTWSALGGLHLENFGDLYEREYQRYQSERASERASERFTVHLCVSAYV